MAHRPEPPRSPHPTLQIGPGHPGHNELDVRISPDHARDLRECLEAEGVDFSNALEFSAEGWLHILSVSLAGGGGAGAVGIAIGKFLDRHKGKKVTFGAQGQVETMENYSAKDVDRVLDNVAQRKRDIDQQWEETIKQLQAKPDAKDKPAPPEDPSPETAN